MIAPRIIPAAEAEELRRVSDAAIESMIAAGAGERETRAAVLVRDLAASVVALHGGIKRLRRLTRRQFDDVLDECQEEVKSPSEDLAYADGTVTDRAFTRPVWDMMEEEP